MLLIQAAALTHLALKLLEDALNETSYLADVAGLHSCFFLEACKISIKVTNSVTPHMGYKCNSIYVPYVPYVPYVTYVTPHMGIYVTYGIICHIWDYMSHMFHM
jgi:uncharacterized ion transporter superfamily protein YfcC